jgi:hypothetical protein
MTVKSERMNPTSPAQPPARIPRRGRWILPIVLSLLLSPALLWLGAYRRTGDSGLVHVADDQIAVILDRWSGERRVVSRPGYVAFLPLLQKVHLLDRSPRALVMQGSRPDGGDRVPQLMARAKDGSSFWFGNVELQYALVPEASAAVLDDAGSEGTEKGGASKGAVVKKGLLLAQARSILRDEFGRYTSEEVARGECIQPATRAAFARLNAALRPHGIEVLGISAGQPSFDKAYEDAIARRKTFDQDAEQLQAQLERLEKDKTQREARAREDKEVEMKKLEGDLVRDLGAAVRDDIRIRQDADDFFLDEQKAGLAMKLEKQGQAALLKARYVGAARAVYKEGLDLERSGDLPVREALVKKLAGIQFDLLPYSRDPAPHRVEYESVTAGPRGKP